MGSIQILTEHWPIVLHVSEGAPTDAQFEAYMRESLELLRKSERHVIVMDSTRLTRVSAFARAGKKAWLDQYGELLRTKTAGTAIVLSSPVLRFISSTMMLLKPFPTPYLVCETVDEAMAWARERLAES